MVETLISKAFWQPDDIVVMLPQDRLKDFKFIFPHSKIVPCYGSWQISRIQYKSEDSISSLTDRVTASSIRDFNSWHSRESMPISFFCAGGDKLFNGILFSLQKLPMKWRARINISFPPVRMGAARWANPEACSTDPPWISLFNLPSDFCGCPRWSGSRFLPVLFLAPPLKTQFPFPVGPARILSVNSDPFTYLHPGESGRHRFSNRPIRL